MNQGIPPQAYLDRAWAAALDPDPHRHGPEPRRAPRREGLLPQDRPLTPPHPKEPEHRVQEHRSQRPQRLLRRLPGRRGRLARDRAAQRHRLHRPVGLRQVDVPAHPQPHARGHPERPRRGRGAARRRQPLRPGRRPGARAPPGRHGLPAAEPVPDDVDQGERAGGRQAQQQAHLEVGRRRPRREVAARARTSGTRSRTASTSPARACPAASSSASASPARSPSRRRCC